MVGLSPPMMSSSMPKPALPGIDTTDIPVHVNGPWTPSLSLRSTHLMTMDMPAMRTNTAGTNTSTTPRHNLGPMARNIATNTVVELDQLLDFVRPRHRMLVATLRADGRPQISPVSGGVDAGGRIVVSSYPARAKTRNAERDPRISVLVLSDEWDGPWVQVDGDAEVLHMPEAADGLVDYFRCISGEHPNWDEYREAMTVQNKSLIRITPTRWSPIATGGFPADVAARLDALR
jgi:PPOX class probable F420-dependent enzyme